MVAGAIEPNRPVPQTSNRSTPQAEIAAVNSTGMAFSKNRAAPAMPANPKTRKKARPQGPGFFVFRGAAVSGPMPG